MRARKRRSISPLEPPRLRRAELPAETVALARFLVGTTIVAHDSGGRILARIVETEAYPPGDPAAHAFGGETARNASMFRRPGHAYVYFIYGMHFCLNVSSEAPGTGGGVLLRAAEPLRGLDLMRARRPRSTDRDLLRGPGRLAAALGVTRADDGLDLTASDRLWLARGTPAASLVCSVRIGITKAAAGELRFYEAGSPYVSGRAARRSPNA